VAADGLIQLVEDRPGGEQVPGGAEGLLDGPELLVAKHRCQRIELSVGAQHKHTIEADWLRMLAAIRL
jgi:hypothetical protein